jgi:hypothetical protein
MEIAEMTNHPNLVGAALLGALAALAGSIAWYGFRLIIDREYFILAIGIGWLVGKAVVLGAGNKRGQGLQIAAGALAFIGIVGGRYLSVNHFLSAAMPDRPLGWLTFRQFMAINARLLERGNGIGDLICSVVAASCAVLPPRPDRLVPEAPTGIQGWRRWVR